MFGYQENEANIGHHYNELKTGAGGAAARYPHNL